mgnify:CR=1 FL=1
MQAGKAMMTLRGVECGPTRLPMPPITEAKRDEFFERVQQAGLLDDVPGALPADNGQPRATTTK